MRGPDTEELVAARLLRRVLPRREGAGDGGAMRDAERSAMFRDALESLLRWLNEGVDGVAFWAEGRAHAERLGLGRGGHCR